MKNVSVEIRKSAADFVLHGFKMAYRYDPGLISSYDSNTDEVEIITRHRISEFKRQSVARAFNTRHPMLPRLRLARASVTSMPRGFVRHRFKIGFCKPKSQDVEGSVLALIASELPPYVPVERSDPKKGSPILNVKVSYNTRMWIEVVDAKVRVSMALSNNWDQIYVGDLYKDDPALISRRVIKVVEVLHKPHATLQAFVDSIK